jgi:O-antigen ligase
MAKSSSSEKQIPQQQEHGIRKLVPRTPGEILLVLLAFFSFWSTAAVEIAAGLMILLGIFRLMILLGIFTLLQTFRNTPADPSLRSRLASGEWATLILLAVYLMAIIGSYTSQHIPFSTHPGLLWHPLVLPAVLALRPGKDEFGRIGVFLLISASAASIFAIAFSFVEQPLQAFAIFVGATTLTNLLAVAGVMAITVAVGKGARGTSEWWAAASAVLVVVAVFRSTERAPILVLVVLGTILLASLRPRILPLWGILAVGLVLFGSDSLAAKFGLILNGYALDRYTVWKVGIKLLSDVPLLGYGPESFQRMLPPQTWAAITHRPPASWHNDILQTALESGPLAALAFVGIIVIALATALQSWRRRLSGPGTAEAGIPGLMFLTLVTLGAVNSAVTSAVLGIAFWTVLGLLLIRSRPPSP